MHEHAPSIPRPEPVRSALSGWRWPLMSAGFLLIAAFFLLTEHRAHILGFLPYLLILACPLMHLFGHGGHGSHANPQSAPPTPDSRELRHEH